MIMTDSVFKAPKAKRGIKGASQNQHWSSSPKKRRRTKEDFVSFCNFVLDYTNFEAMKEEDLRVRNNTSPLDSGGSTADSFTSESLSESTSSVFSSPEPDHDTDIIPRFNIREATGDSDEELITCFCMKPYGGRPMIECSECFTWIHFSCAKIRKTNVPEIFVCQNCRDTKSSTRKSGRVRLDKKVVDA